ncbi:hypothetical protein MAUB_39990 [Mycolicibacterium aubagnense]|uniref:Uncharacterized protein n=1 Tax=Mycolicibacterium aubagnense TaxID=319707 RepID=A0ABM7IHE4_9MYCO|nr:hypothetical protein C1S80_03020 [Mycolicibacterium aubagnense]BBX86126.1 hypothetical protein MAUB_39990 [Mycolicibacterium aubagnense]
MRCGRVGAQPTDSRAAWALFVNASYLQGFSHLDHWFTVWGGGCENCGSWNDRACQGAPEFAIYRNPSKI